MANNSTLKRVFAEVQTLLDTDQYRWIGLENQPEDYFDWGLSYDTTAEDIIELMIDQDDLETAE
jgi:hypothetical protein